MSWWLHAFPLHYDTVYPWARAAAGIGHVPADRPEPKALPRVRDVLQAFQDAGCHGDSWFQVEDLEPETELAACLSKHGSGRYLGEMTLQIPDRAADPEVVRSDTPICGLSFRKPAPEAVLHAMCMLVRTSGSLLVMDDDRNGVVVVPGDQPDTTAEHWPW